MVQRKTKAEWGIGSDGVRTENRESRDASLRRGHLSSNLRKVSDQAMWLSGARASWAEEQLVQRS